MIRLFQLLAAALMIAAAVFFWRQEYETSFVTAVLGMCSFFLSLRFTFKPRVLEREAERARVAAPDDNDSDQ